ncbi:Lipoprotein, partial [Bacillus anthracis str. UR-1]
PMAERYQENQEHPAEKKMRDLMQRIQERYMNKVK